MRINRTCIIPLLLLSTITVAQKPVGRFPQSECFFRAKALGMVIIEDLWVRSFSVGTEYRFANQFAVSADYVHFRWRGEEEVYTTPGSTEDYDEYSRYEPRNYWAFQLKWYPRAFFDFNGIQPYVSLMYKNGGHKLYLEEGYPDFDNGLIGISGQFHDFGLTVGMLTSGIVGGDISFGWRQRTEHRVEEYYHVDGASTFTEINEVKYGPVLRINAYVKIAGFRQR